MTRKSGVPIVLIFAGVGLLTAPGCGEGGPALVQVTGTVTRNNKPLGGAAVMFSPDLDHYTPGATLAEDTTGPDGNYKLRTGKRFGAVPGKYRVTITPPPPESVTKAKIDPAIAKDPFMALISSGVGPSGDPRKKNAGPPTQYTEDCEITPEGSQVQDFDVKIKGVDL